MPRSIDDLINNLDKIEAELKTQLPKIVATYAADGLAEAIDRISKEGVKPGATYSEEPIYVTQKAFNQKGAFKPIGKRATVKDKGKFLNPEGQENKSMYLEHGYKELRELNGLPTKVVNLQFTRRMTQNLTVLSTKAEGEFKVVSTVGAKDQEEKDRLGGMFKKYGDFLAVTPEIAKVINLTPAKTINDIIKKALQ